MGDDSLQSSSPHRHGMQSILHARLAMETDGDKRINRFVLATAQMQNIDDPSSSDNAVSTVAASPPRGPGLLLLEGLLPRLNKVSITNAKLLQRTPNREEVLRCSQQLRSLLDDLKIWETSLPEKWSFKTFPNPIATGTKPFPSTVSVFPTIAVGGIWVANWLAQLSVLRNLILLMPIALRMGIPYPPPTEIRQQIKSTAMLLCSVVPYLLGNVAEDGKAKTVEDTPDLGAFFAVRSLFVAAKLPGSSEEQVTWMLDRLEEIGRDRGIRRALLLRESLISQRMTSISQHQWG